MTKKGVKMHAEVPLKFLLKRCGRSLHRHRALFGDVMVTERPGQSFSAVHPPNSLLVYPGALVG